MQASEFSSTQKHYLDALGIDLWMPRDAVVSEDVLAEEPARSNSAYPDHAHLDGQVVSGSGRAKGLAAVNAALNGPASTAPVEPAGKLPPQVAQTEVPPGRPEATPQHLATTEATPTLVPHFHLQFWCYRSGFWFVSGMHGLAPQHHKFVHGLALYLQGPSQQRAQKPKHVGIFSWPMLDAPNIDQSETVARHYLRQHLSQLQQMSPCDTIIALDDAAQWLADLEEQTVVRLDTGLDLCLNSISEKKRIWGLLQAHRLP